MEQNAVMNQKLTKKNNTPRKLKTVPDLSKYDTIFVGTPVWND